MTESTSEAIDFEPRKEETRARLVALQGERQSLALDLFRDPHASQRLEAVETEIAEAEVELERLAAASAEQERRIAEAQTDAEDQAKAEAMDRARSLQRDREKRAAEVDRAIVKFVSAVGKHAAVCEDQRRALLDAGRKETADQAQARGFYVEGALLRELWAARRQGPLPPLDRMPSIPPDHRRPLAESDPRPVDPAGGDE